MAMCEQGKGSETVQGKEVRRYKGAACHITFESCTSASGPQAALRVIFDSSSFF
jgi:hypothetical protein